MFVLVLMEDRVTVPPVDFNDEANAIKFQISKKYVNRVIPKTGLVIKLHDILSVSAGLVYAGDGASHVTVKFRLVVFRPFVGEVLFGWINRCSPEGIEVSIKFFEHIVVFPEELQDPSEFHADVGLWCWNNEGNLFWMEPDSKIRFVVLGVTFNPIRDEKPKDAVEEEKKEKEWSPMVIYGSIKGYGLGLIDWWQGEGEGEAGSQSDVEEGERLEI